MNQDDDPEDEGRGPWHGFPRLGNPLVNPRTGRLEDFERFQGDEPPSRFDSVGQESDRWGRRVLFSVNQPTGPKAPAVDIQTLIDIRTLEHTVPIDVQIRFAAMNLDGTPIMPFSTVLPAAAGARFRFRVRRTADQLSAPTEDEIEVSSSGGASHVFPWDIFTSKTFQVEALFDNFVFPGIPLSMWVEAIATRVADVATRNRIEGWAIANDNHFQPAVAAPASVILLDGRADRRQFTICNTSTNGALWIGYGNVNPATPIGVLVLPPNGFFTYESPVGGYTGQVTGSWDNAAPDGGALVTEGCFGAPNRITF